MRRVRCPPFDAAAQHARLRANTDITGAEAARVAGKTPGAGPLDRTRHARFVRNPVRNRVPDLHFDQAAERKTCAAQELV
jgi:hypothetical protein